MSLMYINHITTQKVFMMDCNDLLEFLVKGTKELHAINGSTLPKVFIGQKGKAAMVAFDVNDLLTSVENKDVLNYALAHLILMNKNIELIGKTFEVFTCGMSANECEKPEEAQKRIEKCISDAGGIGNLPETLSDEGVFISADSREGVNLNQTLTVDKFNPNKFISESTISNNSQGRLTNHFWLAKEYEEALLSMKRESPSFNQAELARHYERGGAKGQIRAYEVAKDINKILKQNKAQRIYH
jgi:hypothetical protein